jgi:hypothetical protein
MQHFIHNVGFSLTSPGLDPCTLLISQALIKKGLLRAGAMI